MDDPDAPAARPFPARRPDAAPDAAPDPVAGGAAGAAPAAPNAVALYSTIFLHHAPAADPATRRWLLLRRADTKRFAPGRWTGLGGRLEAGELGDLTASALRELREETGLGAADLAAPLRLRRALQHDRPGEPLTTLLYFTAPLPAAVLPPCSEGTLHWVPPAAFAALDVIETTAAALEPLARDVARDPDGRGGVALGWAHYDADGVTVRWNR